MKRTTLLIMAAGIGSRFGGGIKQLEPVGLHDEIIMDYSVHDAIAAGFNKIVFVIRRDIEADFKARVGDRVEALCKKLGVEMHYCFQDVTNIPGAFPEGRTKPWGTGHAVLSAQELLREPFAVLNADDYYGKEAFVNMYRWLQLNHDEKAFAMAGFILKNTMSENGGVTRGICKLEPGHTHLVDVVETKNIVKTADGAEADGVKISPDNLVSMNFWGFPGEQDKEPAYIGMLRENFADFFREEVPANPLKAEYLLPNHISFLLRQGKCTVKVLPTHDKWFGVTYKEDKPAVVESIRDLIARGVYSEKLYSDLG